MAGLNDSLTIARSAIFAHQERLAVIANNIANVDTEGFHRRRVALGTNPPIFPNLTSMAAFSDSTGVRVLDVVRAFNDMTEATLLDAKADADFHGTKSQADHTTHSGSTPPLSSNPATATVCCCTWKGEAFQRDASSNGCTPNRICRRRCGEKRRTRWDRIKTGLAATSQHAASTFRAPPP